MSRTAVALIGFAMLAIACTAQTDATTSTTDLATTSTAFKLPPVDPSLSEAEAEYVESLRLWSISQDKQTTVDRATDIEIANFGKALCDGVTTVVEGAGGEHILDFYDDLGVEMKAQGFNTDSYAAMFSRAIFILCPEHRQATAALIDG